MAGIRFEHVTKRFSTASRPAVDDVSFDVPSGEVCVLLGTSGSGKTPSQIVLRWDVEQGIVAIPRSSNPERLAQNLDVFDFALTAEEVAAISALDTGAEKRVDSDTMGH